MKRLATFLICLLACQSALADTLKIPANIVTHQVPELPAAAGERLRRYANTRSAHLIGWQSDGILVSTRFAQTNQIHRIARPLAYREQITYYDEPVADAVLPAGGGSNLALISRDVGGSEFYQLFLLNLNNGEASMVSDGQSRYTDALWAADGQRFVYTTNQRDGVHWDLLIQNLDGEIESVLESESGYWVAADWSTDGQRLLVLNYVSINQSFLYELDLSTEQLTPLAATDHPSSIASALYDAQGRVFYTSDKDGEFRQLYRLDRRSGRSTNVTEDISWNVEEIVMSNRRDRLLVSVNEGGVSKLKLFRLPSLRELPLPAVPNGILTAAHFHPDGRYIGLSINSATSPTDVYVIDLKAQQLTRWTESEVGGLDRTRFVDAELMTYPTFDDREVPAFVYRPDTPGPHPVVISIHGGPEGQYRPYFSTTVQSYVNQMNVVYIAPNVRGSAGYGKSYLKLDNGRLREDSVKDIGALLDWIGTQEDLDADRVGVIGGSYGGYMVLATMVHYGDRLSAAVERVGISNFVTFLENTQPYRQDLRRVEYGDERDPAMREFLQSISPLNHVDKMRTPLMIAQGANDPRVPASESEQLRVALQEADVPVWYVLANDEGHGFRKKANRDYNSAATFAFFEQYLLSGE